MPPSFSQMFIHLQLVHYFMRAKIISIVLLLSVAFLLVQCRVNRDTKLENSNIPKTEITKTDTTSVKIDSTELLIWQKSKCLT